MPGRPTGSRSQLSQLVAHARAISAQTDGAYDVTVGPLVELWGFGSQGPRDKPPKPLEIAERLELVGFGKLQTRDAPPALRKRVPGLQVDLSSIAKGWAVDQLASLLDRRGLQNYLVEIGGEVLAVGRRPDGKPWRVRCEAVLTPDPSHAAYVDAATSMNASIAAQFRH